MSSNKNRNQVGNSLKGAKVGSSSKLNTTLKFSHNNDTTTPKALNKPSHDNKQQTGEIKASTTPLKKPTTTDNNLSQINLNRTNQKANHCDKLSSISDSNDAENKRPIIRVNLIKKSTKQDLLSSVNRKLLLSRVDSRRQMKPQTNLSVNEKTTNDVSSKDDINQHHHQNEETKTKPDNTKTRNKNSDIATKQQSSHSTEAKKTSKEEVISLIKDLSETVPKDELCKMLKELSSTIDEVQKRQLDNKNNESKQNNISNNNNKSNNKKKQDQPKKPVKGGPHSNDSDASKLSDSIKKRNELETSLDSTTKLTNIKQNKKNFQPKPKIENNLDTMSPHDSDSSDIKGQKLSKQLTEFFLDEDAGKEGVGRKPNISRLPDRCLRITSSHAKYISPHRKRSLEERLTRAQEAREKFLEYRANKFRDILKKVEEMRAWKEEDTLNLKTSVQTKLQKAATKRQEQLDKIIRKAHDEDSKVSEIHFINNLEAQNKRHDINSRKKECEARLQDLQDERQRRFEEKLAKEVAAEERRKTLEAERKAKLLEIQQRRRIKNQKVEQQQQVREKKRIEKNRSRERKITAIKEAYNAGVQTLKTRIDQKHEQSERRHEVNLRLIRQKAFELSIKRYNSFINETRSQSLSAKTTESNNNHRQKDTSTSGDTKRLQLKPFNTKKFCNLCKETISSELALFSHLRSEVHLSSINEHYGNTMLTTNEAVEIHNLRHIVDTDEPLDSEKSSRASSLVNYYHSSYLNQANGICMSESDRESLLAIEKNCRKLRHKLIVAGKPFNRDWFSGEIRSHLVQLLIQQRVARNQTTNTDAASLASTIDLSPNNPNCQQNKPFYLKINRIIRELINVSSDQKISGGGLLPASIIHTVDRLLADLTKQLCGRKPSQLLYSGYDMNEKETDANRMAVVTKMIEFHAIDTLFLYDVVSCLVTILRKMVPNVSLTSKLPSTVSSHYSTLIDPISLNSYYCHKSPILPARIYIRMIGLIQQLCVKHSDLCYVIFQSNNMINLSDILSYRLGFIIGNESPASSLSSISGSSSAATLSAHTIDRGAAKQQNAHSASSSTNSYHPVPLLKTSSSLSCATTGSSKNSKVGVDCVEKKLNHFNDKENGVGVQSNVKSTKPTDDGSYVGEDEEGDFWDRSETYKRTEDVVDELTAGLCKLMATVIEETISRPKRLLNQLDKTAFDQRSHFFITYMVSVGIVDTESVIMSHIHQQQHYQQQQQQQQQQQALSTSSTNINNVAGHNGITTSVSTTTPAGAPDNKCASTTDLFGAQTSVMLPTTGQQQNANNSSPLTVVTASTNNNSASVSSTSMSTNNKIINFTTSCIEFVTSLVKLVTTKLSDDNDETQPGQQQQDSTQLLETLRMTQLSGVLTLVYDMLVHSFNSLTTNSTSSSTSNANNGPQNHAQHSVTTLSNNSLARQLNLALHSLRLINYVAYIDIKFVQSTLKADEMLPLQLRHVCGYLIQYLVQTQFKIVDQQQMQQQDLSYALSTNPNYTVKEHELDLLKNDLMNEIILLLGNFAYLNEDNQLLLKSGRQPTIIEQLISLPFDYFSRENLKLVLMPSLISCAYLNDQICSIICADLSMSLFTAFIEDQLVWAQEENKNRDRRNKSSLVSHELTGSGMGNSSPTKQPQTGGDSTKGSANQNGSAPRDTLKLNERRCADLDTVRETDPRQSSAVVADRNTRATDLIK